MDNATRSNSIRAILGDFKVAADLRGEPDAEIIGDLLCNLAHFCDEEGIFIDLALYRAKGNYQAEHAEGEQFQCIDDGPRKSRLWTILVDNEDGERPLVDLCECDREPTVDEIKNLHDHLQEYDDDCFVIEEYTGIPSIR